MENTVSSFSPLRTHPSNGPGALGWTLHGPGDARPRRIHGWCMVEAFSRSRPTLGSSCSAVFLPLLRRFDNTSCRCWRSQAQHRVITDSGVRPGQRPRPGPNLHLYGCDTEPDRARQPRTDGRTRGSEVGLCGVRYSPSSSSGMTSITQRKGTKCSEVQGTLGSGPLEGSHPDAEVLKYC